MRQSPPLAVYVSMVNTNFIGQSEWVLGRRRRRGNACMRDMGELDNDAGEGEEEEKKGL